MGLEKVTHHCLNRLRSSVAFLTFVSLKKILPSLLKCALSLSIHRRIKMFLSWKTVCRYSHSKTIFWFKIGSRTYFPHQSWNYCYPVLTTAWCLQKILPQIWDSLPHLNINKFVFLVKFVCILCAFSMHFPNCISFESIFAMMPVRNFLCSNTIFLTRRHIVTCESIFKILNDI